MKDQIKQTKSRPSVWRGRVDPIKHIFVEARAAPSPPRARPARAALKRFVMHPGAGKRTGANGDDVLDQKVPGPSLTMSKLTYGFLTQVKFKSRSIQGTLSMVVDVVTGLATAVVDSRQLALGQLEELEVYAPSQRLVRTYRSVRVINENQIKIQIGTVAVVYLTGRAARRSDVYGSAPPAPPSAACARVRLSSSAPRPPYTRLAEAAGDGSRCVNQARRSLRRRSDRNKDANGGCGAAVARRRRRRDAAPARAPAAARRQCAARRSRCSRRPSIAARVLVSRVLVSITKAEYKTVVINICHIKVAMGGGRGRGRARAVALRVACAGGGEAARALHRLAFALWRAAFHLQKPQLRLRRQVK
ncbi:hypothetical protein EVAR_33429_1 [Eumeta japonica]|uniref:Uncharacterized protein n=1 Tax=Eumeta variegata TaxID=151549 RepID=A0A4C1W1Q9_EUMVA|nr:hypothetical protein EVAR_33429_1 [Eumeta japonica]